MWRNFLKILTFSIFFNGIFCMLRKNLAQIALEQEVVSIKNYVFWPNATVPFYVNPEHFDHEQSLAILTALSMFAFKTCLKFAPVMAAPQSNEHVMVFENPNGIRRCVVDTMGHSVFEPHRVVIGYDCLQSPNIDMMIMRSLGFPFEHNKPSRAVYIDVLHENIEPGHTDLFTLEAVQAMELSALPYDINSVMHFGDRDYSKNGHRTIMFKDPNMKQNKVGLTHMDLRKIDAVYGPECRTRDRQEKLDLCQSYPGVARRKREARPDEVEPAETTVEAIKLDKEGKKESVEVLSNTENVKSGIENEGRDENVEIKDIEEPKSGDLDKQNENVVSEKKDIKIDVTQSLRINPNITPPPHIQLISLNAELGIADGLQDLVDNVFKLSKLALNNAREKYCFNNTVGIRPSTRTTETNATDSDILGIVDLVVEYVNGMVNHAKSNLTQFCLESESIDRYSRYGCNSGSGRDCPQSYRSTKSGPVRHSTQHRPTYFQSTKLTPRQRNIFDHHNEGFRKKRSVDVEAVTEQLKKVDDKVKDNNDNNNDFHKAQDDDSGNNATKISNRDEDPPLHIQLISLNAELGIADGLQDLVDNVFNLSKLALNNAREKYCFNNTVGIRPITRTKETNATDSDILGIVDLVVQYVNGMVNHAKSNLTQFCLESESIDRYSRYGCNSGSGRDCPQSYRSTKSGPVRHSTQHRPTYFQSTKLTPRQRNIFDHHNEGFRKKRSVDVEAVTEQLKKVDDKVNNDTNNDVPKAQDNNGGNNATEISNRDEDDGAIKINKEKDIDGDGTGKSESNNKTRGEKNDVEIKMKNENETEDINQAEEMKNDKESKKNEETLTIKVNHQPIRRRDRHYRRKEYDSSLSAEKDRNQKYKVKQPSSEVDERQSDPRQYKDELERIEREKVEEEQLKYRLELKRQRDEEYDKKFQKHLPESSNEVALKLDEYTNKRDISSSYIDKTTHKVKNTLTSAENSYESNIKRNRDRNENKRVADRDSDQKWSKVKKIEPIATYERESENKKYSDTEDGKHNNNNKYSDAEYKKIKEYDEGYKRPEKTIPEEKKYDEEETVFKRPEKTQYKEKKYDEEEREYKLPEKTQYKEKKYDEVETEYKRPEKTQYKEKKSDVQSESVESEKEEKRITTKKGRQMMKKMKKKIDGGKEDKKQQSVEDEIANSEEQPSGTQNKEISRMNLPRLVKLSKANEEFYKDRRWPGGEVRYHIQEDTTYDTEDLRNRIEEVNDILKAKTCVYLKELTADQATEYEDYLVIDNSPDYVTGRVGGRQKFGSIELFRGDQHRQHTAMMVMAWLGFYFEVSRHDRDKYVRVHMRHIRPDKLHHFEKIRGDATLNLPYDYESATHPAWQYWRQIGRKGISTVATYKHKDPEGTIMKSLGQNEKLLSDIDIVKINSVYGLSCKRHERAKEKAKTKEKEAKIKYEPETSSSGSSSSSTEDTSE